MIIGREKEIRKLQEATNSEYSEFVAVYGRRRVGKTFLIREAFNYSFTFQHTGTAKANLKDQLLSFKKSLQSVSKNKYTNFKSWYEAFFALEDWLESLPEGRKTIFLDELPWMDSPRSNFISGLEHFWNSWASARKDITLIVCGSATSWIINKLINNHGGLHNRLTQKIYLQPFTLRECELYVNSRRLSLTKKNIVEGYMIMGGIPYYWSLLEKGLSMSQNIDNLFFSKNSEALSREFDLLYASLFNNPLPYMNIVSALSEKGIGMSREEIITATNLPRNGELTRCLNELEWCGFIRRYNHIGRISRDCIYQLIDNYTLFYFQYVKRNSSKDVRFWSNNYGSPLYNTWSGLAFERVCLQHIDQIKQGLGINGVSSSEYSWRCNSDEERGIDKAQIDLLIDRKDDVINICEIKFANDEYVVTADEDRNLIRRRNSFIKATCTRKTTHITMICPYGVKQNSHSDIVQSVVTLNDLFK
jgi:hypothetical protein